jgi:two-component system, NarL family, sensor histidine kinase DevS
VESSDPDRLPPGPRLGELLTDRPDRLQAALATQERVRALLEAVVGVASDLELETVLRRIVEAAVTLVDAQFGALGVIGDGAQLAEFIPVGLDEAAIARIDHWPEGKGLLGLLIRDPRPLRLTDIGSHPQSSGFPAGHPHMRSFLGVPIRIRDEVYGNLYLAEKRDGAAFDEEDEVLVTVLSSAAGVAIQNARLYDESQRQQRWLRASSEVTRRLLAGTPVDDVLGFVTQQTLEITGADLVILAVPDEELGYLTISHAVGSGAEAALGLRLPAEASISGEVLAAGRPVTVEDFRHDTRAAEAVRRNLDIGPAIVFPLGGPGNVGGVLTVGSHPGAPPLNRATAELVTTFAAQAGIVLELDAHRREAEDLAVLQDRDRIARDLHDQAIQRIYASGMKLQGVIPLLRPQAAQDRVSSVVDDLDTAIDDIRHAIFTLHTRGTDEAPSLRAQVAGVIEEMTGPAQLAATVRIDAGLDHLVPGDVGDDMLRALREALSNAARHGRATAVEVAITLGSDLVLLVRDNGIGMSDTSRRSGLANLAYRAAQHGGTLTVGPASGGGTELHWRVPLGG